MAGLTLDDLQNPDFKALPEVEQRKGRQVVYDDLMKNDADFRGLPSNERARFLNPSLPKENYTQRPDLSIGTEISEGFKEMTAPQPVGTNPTLGLIKRVPGALRMSSALFAPVTNLVSRGAKAISAPFENLPPLRINTPLPGATPAEPGKGWNLAPAQVAGKTAEIVGDIGANALLAKGAGMLKEPLRRALPTIAEKTGLINQRLSQATQAAEDVAANQRSVIPSMESIAQGEKDFRLGEIGRREAAIPGERQAIAQRVQNDIAAEQTRLTGEQARVGEAAARAAGPVAPRRTSFDTRYEALRKQGEAVTTSPVNLNTSAKRVSQEKGIESMPTTQAERTAAATTQRLTEGAGMGEIEEEIGNRVRRMITEGTATKKIDYDAITADVLGPVTSGDVTATQLIDSVKRLRAAERAAYDAGHKNLGRQFGAMERAALVDLAKADPRLARLHRSIDKDYFKQKSVQWYQDGVQQSFNDKTGNFDRGKFAQWFAKQQDENDNDRFLKRMLGDRYDSTKTLVQDMQRANDMNIEKASGEVIKNIRKGGGTELAALAKEEKGFDAARKAARGDFTKAQKAIGEKADDIEKQRKLTVDALNKEAKTAIEEATGKPWHLPGGRFWGSVMLVHGVATMNPTTIWGGAATIVGHNAINKLLSTVQGTSALQKAIRAAPGTAQAFTAGNAIKQALENLPDEGAQGDFLEQRGIPLDATPAAEIDTRRSSEKPQIKNRDGTVSSERTIGVEADGKHYLIPTIVNGKQLSRDQAIREWEAGKNKPVGIYPTQKAADLGAKARTERLSRELKPESYYGYSTREPSQSERDFFNKNPNVAGMASEDGRIVLNPQSKLGPTERSAVARNEAARLWMRDNKVTPSFALTPDQKKKFEGTPYAKDEAALKQTIVARIISGDPSAGNVTPEQRQFSESIRGRMEGRETSGADKKAALLKKYGIR